MFEMQNTPGLDATGLVAPTGQPNKLAGNHFNSQETTRLAQIRDRVARGELNEWTGAYKHLLFARWLYEHGRIEEGPPGGAPIHEKNA